VSTPRRTGVAKWCEDNGIGPGDAIERFYDGEGWVALRVTALGENAILARRKNRGEFAHDNLKRVRLKVDA